MRLSDTSREFKTAGRVGEADIGQNDVRPLSAIDQGAKVIGGDPFDDEIAAFAKILGNHHPNKDLGLQ